MMMTKPSNLEQQLEWYLQQEALKCSNNNCECHTTNKRHCVVGEEHNSGMDENPSLTFSMNVGWIYAKCWSTHSEMKPALMLQKIDTYINSEAPTEYSEYTNTASESLKNNFPENDAINRIKDRQNTITGGVLSVDKYLEDRKLSQEVKEAFKLKDNKAGIIMPYLDEDGVEVATRIRRDDQKKWKKGSKSHHPYGLHLLDKDVSTITIVEGESDTHAVWDNRAKLGAVLGTAGNPHAIHNWDTSIWENYSDIRIAIDYGFKGYESLDSGALKLIDSANKLPEEHKEKIKLWILPKPYKDFSELVASTDKGAVHDIQLLTLAQYVEQPLLAQIEALYDIEDKNVINHFRSIVSKLGLMEDISQVILHVLESTNSDDPLACVVKGTSGSGKNHHVENILKFVPADRVIKFTNASPMALFYDDESYQNKILYKAEAGWEDPAYMKVERSLLSEKKLKLITVKDQESLKLEKAGPTGFLTTTTNAKLYHDNETRVMSITIPNDQNYLNRVKKQQLVGAINPNTSLIVNENKEFIALHKYNQMQNWNVVLEEKLAYALVELVQMTDSEQNRDLAQLIGLMKSSARLNYMWRNSWTDKDTGRNILMADIEDYENVHTIANQMVSESLGVSIPSTSKNTYNVLKAMNETSYNHIGHEVTYYSVNDILEYFEKNKQKLKQELGIEKLKGKTGLNDDIKKLLKAEFLEQNPMFNQQHRLRVKPFDRTEIVYKRIYPTVVEIEEYLNIQSIQNGNDNPSSNNESDLPLELYPPDEEADNLDNDIQY